MATVTKAQQAERLTAIEALKVIFPIGSPAYTILRHVSQSGMSRAISVVAVDEVGARDVSWHLVKAGLYKEHATKDGLKVGGCGMDMGFAVVYDLSMTLYNDGYAIKQTWL